MPPFQSRQMWVARAVAFSAAVLICWTYVQAEPALVHPTPRAASDTVDMHVHTTESDGDRTAEAQIDLAKRSVVSQLWIADHDFIRDIPRVRQLQAHAEAAGVALGFAVEITVGWAKKEHHLLGYFPNSAWSDAALSAPMAALQSACAVVKSSREARNTKLVEHLNSVLGSTQQYFTSEAEYKGALASPITVAAVAQWAAVSAGLLEPTSLGRPHFAKYLQQVTKVNKDLVFGPRAGMGKGVLTSEGKVLWDEEAAGVAGTPVEALMHSAVLEAKSIAFEPLPISDAIRLIASAGGRAVVAHLPTLGPDWADKFGPLLADLRKDGLWGVEGFSSEVSEDNHAAIARLAAENQLVVTGGSDNHGSLKPYASLGDVHRVGSDRYTSLAEWAAEGTGISQAMLRGTSAKRTV